MKKPTQPLNVLSKNTPELMAELPNGEVGQGAPLKVKLGKKGKQKLVKKPVEDEAN